MEQLREILQLADDTKYLVAAEKYQELLAKRGTAENTTDELASILDENSAQLKQMVQRAEEIRLTLKYEDVESDEWILGSSYLGIMTHYKRNPEDNSLTVKMNGEMENMPIFEQCAVVHEVDLFKQWVPLCPESKQIKKFGPADIVAYMNLGLPLLSRDILIRAYGADCLASHGKIVILGQSIDSHDGPEVVPLKPVSWCHNRAICKEFKFVIDITSPTSAKTSIIAHVNPNTNLPQSLINFLMKNLAGMFLHFFQKQVHKVASHPTCDHAEQIRSNREFYVDWLLPKMRAFCDFKGWEQPIIKSLGEDGIPRTNPVGEAAEVTQSEDTIAK